MNNYVIFAVVLLGVVSVTVEAIGAVCEKLDTEDSYCWGPIGDCSEKCDTGTAVREKFYFNETTQEFTPYSPDREFIFFQCNMFPCGDRERTYTNCTAKCGGGHRFIITGSGKTHKILCNTHHCDLQDTVCESDIIFVMDSSATIGEFNFYELKQFTMDIVSALNMSKQLSHIGAVSFSNKVFRNLELGAETDKEIILKQLWDIPYLAGMTNTADALMEMRRMSESHHKVNKTQVAIVLTDGISNRDHQRTLKEAKLAHKEGIHVIVIGIDLNGEEKAKEEMRGISSTGKYYAVPSVAAIMNITDIILRDTCSLPPTTTTEATTTTEPITTPSPFEVDCRKCDFTQGQIWRPDVHNCHGFYICEQTSVKGKYRITRMTCGDLYWDQDKVTCVRKPQPGCNANATPIPTIKNTGTTEAPKCTYKTNPKNNRQFKPKSGDNSYQTCPLSMHFDDSDSVCTCIPDSDSVDNCKNDMLLHFPYDDHLNDVTCHKAKSSLVGDKVVIVQDAVRGRVAKFNGHGYLEVPFIRKYFAGNTILEFTVAYFFKVTGRRNQGRAAIVSNGDCKESSTFESGYSMGRLYYHGKSTNSRVKEHTSFKVVRNTWYHVAWVYNGHHLVLYVNGAKVSSRKMTGPLANTDVPMDVGARCGEFYHTGLVDELQIYHEELSAKRILGLSKE